MIVECFATQGAGCLAELVKEEKFRQLRIYEPGLIGPFRKYLKKLPNYQNSFFWDDVDTGDFRDGLVSEQMLTFFPEKRWVRERV